MIAIHPSPYRGLGEGYESFQWEYVKDYVIPFLTLLDRRYVLDLAIINTGTLPKPDQNIQIKIKGKKADYYTSEVITNQRDKKIKDLGI